MVSMFVCLCCLPSRSFVPTRTDLGVFKPLLAFSARGAHLEGGNCGVQKCDFLDPLSLEIKCLGGGGAQVGGLNSPDV